MDAPKDELEATLIARIRAIDSETEQLNRDRSRAERTLAAHLGMGVRELRVRLKRVEAEP